MLGLKGDMKLVALGGVREEMAALRAGTLDGRVTTLISAIPLEKKGIIREILDIEDYLPKPWAGQMIYARREFVKERPDAVKKANRAYLEATRFVKRNRQWTVEKLKSYFHWSDEAASEGYKAFLYSPTNKIDRRGIVNVRDFLIEYRLIAKEAQPADELFTNEFTE